MSCLHKTFGVATFVLRRSGIGGTRDEHLRNSFNSNKVK